MRPGAPIGEADGQSRVDDDDGRRKSVERRARQRLSLVVAAQSRPQLQSALNMRQ
jgi:hypothetical protein